MKLTLPAWLTAVLLTLSSLSVQASLPPADSQGQALPSLAPMLDRVTPGVVNISTKGTVYIRQNRLFADPFFEHFFGGPAKPRKRQTQSLGSGVIVDADKGYILTNNHVIDKAEIITVTLRSGESHQAKVIGTDPETDIALIQIEAKNLTAIPMGKSEHVRVGDFAVAIGNPFGLGQTVTSGIISALERSGLGIEGYENFIQTDASINPGNSGGALVNLRGELIGINTAIYSKSGGNIGIGFAIPISMASNIMQQILTHGEVKRGRLGAQAQDLTPELARAFELPKNQGAVVTQVVKDSPADRAGLRPGDIVIAINEKKVRNADTLRNTIGLLPIGERVSLTILREGKKQTLQLQVEKIEQSSDDSIAGEKLHAYLEGSRLSNIVSGSGSVEGVLVEEVEEPSPAVRIGLRSGDIITSANRKQVKNLQQLENAIKISKSLLLNIRRGNSSLFLYLQ